MEIASSAGYLQLQYGRDLRLRLLGFDVKGSGTAENPSKWSRIAENHARNWRFCLQIKRTCVAEEHKEPSMDTLGWIILGGLLMSAIALVGSLTIVLRPATLEHLILPLVSLAAGTLLGGAVFHMFPIGFAALSPIEGGVWLLAGFASFLALEQFLHWHHCHRASAVCRKPMTYLILLGDALHNFLGGLSVAGTFLVDPRAGVMAWIAAAAHEIPQELGDFGVLIHGGWNRRHALMWNFLSGLTFLVGALTAYGISLRFDVAGLILLGAGNFIYIGASDLVPEIKAHPEIGRAAMHFLCFAAGVLFMLYLAYEFQR